MIRLVATDLDGTLWDRTVRAHPASLVAIAELQQQGVIVLAATGRRPRSARIALEENGLAIPAVCLDGTFGEDWVTGHRFHQELFSAAEAHAILAVFADSAVAPNVFVDHPELDVLLEELPTHQPERAEALLPWAHIGPLSHSVPQHKVAAFTVIGGALEALAPVAGTLVAAGLARATLTSDSLYGGTSLSVIPHAASKWAGVAAYASARGIAPEEIIGVGDAANDVELLAGAGLAVAVRGASAEVLALAGTLIERPTEGGWSALVDICASHS